VAQRFNTFGKNAGSRKVWQGHEFYSCRNSSKIRAAFSRWGLLLGLRTIFPQAVSAALTVCFEWRFYPPRSVVHPPQRLFIDLRRGQLPLQ
jgi:hypothetical protein